MTNALKWVRKSKGSDDDIGLEDQRDQVEYLAEELADDTEWFDLGVQTGFSTLTRDPDATTTWLDQLDEVRETVEDLRNGEYDFLVALDDRRICRDNYLAVIKHAATEGGCEVVYVRDVAEDDLTYDLHRRVERETKEEEIEKAKRALERRQEQGYDHGRPRFGMEYDDDGRFQVPGEDFETVLRIFRLRDDGESYPTIADEVDVSTSTVRRVCERRDWYLDRADASVEAITE